MSLHQFAESAAELTGELARAATRLADLSRACGVKLARVGIAKDFRADICVAQQGAQGVNKYK